MKRILIIEDDPRQSGFFKIVLEKARYSVHEASNAKTGLQFLEQYPCDLVITDIHMPNNEGMKIILVIKEKNPTMKTLAIGDGEIIDASSASMVAEKIGADRTLNKPIGIVELEETVA